MGIWKLVLQMENNNYYCPPASMIQDLHQNWGVQPDSSPWALDQRGPRWAIWTWNNLPKEEIKIHTNKIHTHKNFEIISDVKPFYFYFLVCQSWPCSGWRLQQERRLVGWSIYANQQTSWKLTARGWQMVVWTATQTDGNWRLFILSSQPRRLVSPMKRCLRYGHIATSLRTICTHLRFKQNIYNTCWSVS